MGRCKGFPGEFLGTGELGGGSKGGHKQGQQPVIHLRISRSLEPFLCTLAGIMFFRYMHTDGSSITILIHECMQLHTVHGTFSDYGLLQHTSVTQAEGVVCMMCMHAGLCRATA